MTTIPISNDAPCRAGEGLEHCALDGLCSLPLGQESSWGAPTFRHRDGDVSVRGKRPLRRYDWSEGGLASWRRRLWQVDISTCEIVHDQLVRERLLSKKDKGFYIAADRE
jgi:hypothetical protein